MKDELNVFSSGGKVVHVGDEIHLLDANGKPVHVAKNDGVKVRSTRVRGAEEPFKTGWIAYAGWTNSGSSPISSFVTTWAVPPVPATDNGQLVYLFNSIEPAGGQAILQPVLQYGRSPAGGGSYWAATAWYVVGTQSYYGSLASVSVGDTLTGEITLTSTDGTNYNYVSDFSGISGATITVQGSQQLVWATETLEAYGVTTASDYPSGSTAFYAIGITLSDGSNPPTSWSTVSDPDDGLSATVNIDGSVNAQVTIGYPS
jgi:hypothetical protein